MNRENNGQTTTLKIFISHNHYDRGYCVRLADALRHHGADVWYYEKDLNAGIIEDVVQQQIFSRPVFIVMLSKKAIYSSEDWVRHECLLAQECYRMDQTRIILPVIIEQLDQVDLIGAKGEWLFLTGFSRVASGSHGPILPEDLAIKEVLRRLKLIPDEMPSFETLIARGRIAFSQKLYQEAVDLFTQAAQIIPDNYDAWLLLGIAHDACGNYREAATAFDYAIQCNDSNAIAWAFRGLALAEQGSKRSAIISFDVALKLDPQKAIASLRRYDQALLAVFDEGVRQEPQNERLLLGQGIVLSKMERWEEALTPLKLALLEDRTNDAGWYYLGICFENLATSSESSVMLLNAIYAFKQAIQMNPLHIDAWRALSQALRDVDHFDEAVACIDKALAQGFDELQTTFLKYDRERILREQKGEKPEPLQHHPEMERKEISLLDAFEKEQLDKRTQRWEDIRQRKELIRQSQEQGAMPSFGITSPTLEQLLLVERMDRLVERQSSSSTREAEQYYQQGRYLEKENKWEEALAAYEEAIKKAPNEAKFWRSKGGALRTLKRNEEALQAYNRAIELAPQEPHGYTLKAMVLAAMRQYDEALQACEQAIQVDQSFAMAWDTKGDILRKIGRKEDALSAYIRAINENPRLTVAYIDRGNLLIEMRHYSAALAAYEEAIAIQPDAEGWNNKGIALRALQRYEEAVNAHNHALELDPTYVDAWYSKGLTFRAMNRYDDAIAAFQQAIALNDSMAIIYKNLADALRTCGRYQEALAAYERVIALDPSSSAYTDKGITLRLLHQFDAALTAHDKALRQDDKDAYAWHSRGRTYFAMGKYEPALKNIDEALHLKPDNDEFARSRVQVMIKQGRFEDALQWCQRVIDRAPQRSFGWLMCSIIYHAQKQYESALNAIDRAIMLDPNDLRLLNAKAYLLADLQRFPDALATIDEAIARQPDDADLLDSKGELLIKAQRAVEALPYLDRALEYDSYSSEIWRHKASVLNTLQRYDDALEAINRAMKLKPTHARLWREKAQILRLLSRNAEANEADREADRFSEFNNEEE